MIDPRIRLIICASLIAACSVFSDEPVKNLKAKDISAAIEMDEKIVILDIRTPEEFKEGRLAKAVNIDFMADDFEATIDKLDRDKTYVVHCKSGGRSGRAMAAFKEKGFKSILHMSDGFLGWSEAGLKSEK